MPLLRPARTSQRPVRSPPHQTHRRPRQRQRPSQHRRRPPLMPPARRVAPRQVGECVVHAIGNTRLSRRAGNEAGFQHGPPARVVIIRNVRKIPQAHGALLRILPEEERNPPSEAGRAKWSRPTRHPSLNRRRQQSEPSSPNHHSLRAPSNSARRHPSGIHREPKVVRVR